MVRCKGNCGSWLRSQQPMSTVCILAHRHYVGRLALGATRAFGAYVRVVSHVLFATSGFVTYQRGGAVASVLGP